MAFATTDDLASFLGSAIENEARAQLALDLATGIIRAETGQTLSLVEDDEVTLRGSRYSELVLPERPVVGVASVAGEHVNDDDWTLHGGTLARSVGWPEVVAVRYSHGYDPIPDDVRAICLAVAARVLRENDSAAPQIASETIGSYSVTYTDTRETSTSTTLLTDGERAHLRRTYRPSVGMVSLR